MGVNLFWMDFRDEIVPEGKLNENTGLPITINADRSVHAGIEMSGAFSMTDAIVLSGNAAYNHNRIKKYNGEITVYPVAGAAYQADYDLAGNTIAGFPDWLGNFVADYSGDRLRLTGRVRLAGKQYVGLFNSDSLAIDGHTTVALSGSYRIPALLGVGDVTFQFRVDNLFDKKYEAAGYGWTYGLSSSEGMPVGLVHEGEYFVAAERTFYAQLQLEMF
jgi:iron complex outermembrane receptor protein